MVEAAALLVHTPQQVIRCTLLISHKRCRILQFYITVTWQRRSHIWSMARSTFRALCSGYPTLRILFCPCSSHYLVKSVALLVHGLQQVGRCTHLESHH